METGSNETASSAEARVKEHPGFLMVPNCLGVEGGVPILFEDELMSVYAVTKISRSVAESSVCDDQRVQRCRSLSVAMHH